MNLQNLNQALRQMRNKGRRYLPEAHVLMIGATQDRKSTPDKITKRKWTVRYLLLTISFLLFGCRSNMYKIDLEQRIFFSNKRYAYDGLNKNRNSSKKLKKIINKSDTLYLVEYWYPKPSKQYSAEMYGYAGKYITVSKEYDDDTKSYRRLKVSCSSEAKESISDNFLNCYKDYVAQMDTQIIKASYNKSLKMYIYELDGPAALVLTRVINGKTTVFVTPFFPCIPGD